MSSTLDRVQYQLDPIAYRSVGEKKLAEKILTREGQWDAERQCFLTKEKLLQDLTRQFQSLNTLLRHAPVRSYATEGRNLDAKYPKAPKFLMTENNISNSQLSMEDPTKQNIEYRRQIAAKNTLIREREMEGMRAGGGGGGGGGANSGGGSGGGGAGGVVLGGKEQMEWIENLERDFVRASSASTPMFASSQQQHSSCVNASLQQRRSLAASPKLSQQHQSMNLSAASALNRSVTASPQVGTNANIGNNTSSTVPMTTQQSPPLPRIAPEFSGGNVHTSLSSSSSLAATGGAAPTTANRHSSLLMQLKSTKAAYQKHQASSTIVASILSMDTSAAMKSAVTRMFANPKQADAISQEEHDRREREFMEERTRTAAYQENLVREEREAIERELAQMK